MTVIDEFTGEQQHECSDGIFHAWSSHSAKGCLAHVPDPDDDHAVCPCPTTHYELEGIK